MRTFVLALTLAGSAFSSSAQAEGGFTRDTDFSSLSQVLSASTFGDLAVGDSAYASPGHFCWSENELYLVSTLAIGERYDWSANLKVLRKTGGEVELTTELGARADAESRHSTVKQLSVSDPCNEKLARISFQPESVTLFKVQAIDGFTTLSDWAGSVAEADAAKSDAQGASDAAASDAGSMGWVFRQEKDEITDQTNVFISGFSTEGVRGTFGNEWMPMLTLRCLRNTSAVVVNIEDFMVNDRVPVSYRFDDESPTSERWSVATNRKAVGLWSGGQSIPFITRLVDASKLTMRVETEDAVYTFSFDVAGARPHVEMLAEACNWSL